MGMGRVRYASCLALALSGCAGRPQVAVQDVSRGTGVAVQPREAAQEASPAAELPASAPRAGTDWESVRRTDQVSWSIDRDPEVARLTPLVRKDPEANLSRLVDALVAGKVDEFERVRAIHDRIARNIAYDVAAYRGEAPTVTEPLSVIRHGASVCYGYAQAFALMCSKAGIECQVVTGYGRGVGFDPFEEDDLPFESQHAWNAVRIGNGWYLVDTTWDAGDVDARTDTYTWAYSTGYLFTPPEVFLCTHFPEDPCWQLRDQPISYEQFRSLPYLLGAFGTMGFGLEGPAGRVLRVEQEAEVPVRVPPNAGLAAYLWSWDGATPDPLLDQVGLRREGDLVRVRAAFSAAGRYGLSLYGDPGGDSRPTEWLGELFFVSPGGSSKRFPRVQPEAASTGLTLDVEDGYDYRVGGAASFALSYPGEVEISLYDRSGRGLLNHVWVGRDGDRRAVSISFPEPGEYSVSITTGSGTGAAGLRELASLSYVAEAASDLAYPYLSPQGQQSGFSLVGPQGYGSTVDGETRFSFRVRGRATILLRGAGGSDLKGRTLLSTDGDHYTARISFPQAGSHEVWVYVPSSEKANSWIGVARLEFQARSASAREFPDICLGGAELGFQIVAPLDRYLKAEQDLEFEVAGPVTGEVTVAGSGGSARLRNDGGRYRGTVHVTGSFITLFYSEKSGAAGVAVAQYEVR